MSKAKIEYDIWQVEPYMQDGSEFDISKWDEVTHILTRDWKFKYDGDYGCFEIVIKKGFITDGGSVPNVFSALIRQWGINTPAFLVHDALYAGEIVDREKADWIMLEIMQACGENWFNRNVAWRSVRRFGGIVWNKHIDEIVNNALKLININISRNIITPDDCNKALMDLKPQII